MSHPDHIYDVAVIGAGPAGATAARYLAQAGLNVIIMEKECWPRDKTCGGGLTSRAFKELPSHFNLPVQQRCHSSTINISNTNLRFTAHRDKPIIYMTMRDELDAELVSMALVEGAEFRDDWPLRELSSEGQFFSIRSHSETIKSRLLIAADGTNSMVANQLRFPDHRILAPAIEWEIPLPSQQMNPYIDNALFDFGLIEDGYAWIFPKQGHLSVGLGAMRGRGRHLPQTLAVFLKSHNIPFEKAKSRKGHLIPVSPRKGPLAQNRAFLVGDAAGLVDPVTAEGLFYAMCSGRLAAEAIIKSDAHPDKSTSLYQTMVQAELLGEIRNGNWLAMLLYSMPRWRNWLFKRHGQRLTERMADLVMGEINYRDVLMQGSFWLRLMGLK